MSTHLVKKQLQALTQAPEQQVKQSKTVKRLLQKERKKKAVEAKAKAEKWVLCIIRQLRHDAMHGH